MVPSRRPASSASPHQSFSSPTSMLRSAANGSYDSGYPATDMNSRSDALTSEQKIVHALVGRLVNKLPCNSGIRLAMMEVDPGVQATVKSLLQLAKLRLSLVVQALTSALESVSKYSSSSSLSDVPLDTRHSQLYLLYILDLGLTTSWQEQASESTPSSLDLPRCWPDPQPFDESLARYLASVVVIYARLVSAETPAVPGTSSPAPSTNGSKSTGMSSSSSAGRLKATTAKTHALAARFIRQHSYARTGSSTTNPRPSPDGPTPLSQDCLTLQATTTLMSEYTSRIVFYLSASNWPVLYSRIKSRVTHLTTTIEDTPDVAELKLIQWANLDRNRLITVIQEVATVFLNVKRPAQPVLAMTVREAIWRWITVYPAEYEAMVADNTKLDPGVDHLFDILSSISDIGSTSNARRTRAFYPLMAMLLVLLPDTLKRIAMSELSTRGSSSGTKKASYIDSLRKGLNTSKGFETCVACYVDLVRASVAVSPKLEQSGIRGLGLDIQNDLKHALFSSTLASEIANRDLLVDGLIALHRADPSGSSVSLFIKMLTDTAEKNRIVAIRAAIDVAADAGRLPWQDDFHGFCKELGPTLRSIFKNLASTLVGPQSNRRPRTPPDMSAPEVDLTIEILDLYQLVPSFAFNGSHLGASSSDEITKFLMTLSALTVQPSPAVVRPIASRTAGLMIDHLRQLAIQTGDIESEAKLAAAVWQIPLDAGRQTLFSFHGGNLDDIAVAIASMRESSIAMLRLAEETPNVLFPSAMAQPATMVVSVAGFTALLGPDAEQTALTLPMLSVYGKLTRFAHLSASAQTTGKTGLAPAMRANAFDALAKLPISIGRQQQQRQIRRALRPLAMSTPFTVGLWIGLAAIAQNLTAKIVAAEADSTLSNRDARRRVLTADIDGLDEDESKEWQNLTAFLCATVNVSAYESSAPPSLCDLIGKGVLPAAYDQAVPDPAVPIELFIQQCVELLVCGSITVRESVKAALGSELPTNATRLLVAPMIKLLSHADSPAGITVSDTFTIFAEQAVAILRLLVDRMGPHDDVPAVQVDLGELLYDLARYVDRLGRHDSALRLKTKYCQLVEVVLGKPEHVVLSNSVKLRNGLLDWMSEWSSESSREHEVYLSNLENSGKAQKELDLACMMATVSVTEDLVLRTSPDEAEDSQGVAKSRLFFRHYIRMVKVLERSNHEESEFTDYSSLHGIGVTSILSPGSEDPSALAIQILSNLLSANVDVGLKHCLALGYHEDPILRTAFMQVLSTALRRGAPFGGLSTKRVSTAPRSYLDLLAAPNIALAIAMVDVCPQSSNEVEELSTLLFRVYEGRGALLGLLRALIEREVAMTNHESELFRANSITMRMLTIFARTYGYNYVRATLQPLVLSLIEKPTECSFELDPAKATDSDDIERNADHLRLMCQALLDMICSSTARVPLMFRALCHHIWEVVNDRFPDSRHSAIGSFIFLRFFCPAIVSPESIDLDLSPDSRETRRALLLITKVIQNLANNVVFKEPHMRVLNSFLSENIRQVTRFLSDIALRPRTGETQAATKAFQSDAEKHQDCDGDDAIIHHFVHKHRSKLEASLSSMPMSFRHTAVTKTPRTEFGGRDALDNLVKVMDQTGPPSALAGLSASGRSQVYDDFMRHNAGRSTDGAADAFYEGPASQNGQRIFYFIMSRVALVQYDLLAYHIFSILDRVTGYFDLVVDLTGSSAANELPIAWLKRMIQMCPPGIIPCINTLALYNPNSFARKKLKRTVADLASVVPSFGRNVVAASAPSELAGHIPFTSLALPEYTMALAFEADHVFTNLLCVADHDMQVPVVVKLGRDSLQIASWKKQEIVSSIRSYIIDVIKLNDIDDIVSSGDIPSDQLLIRHGHGETVTFISRKRNEMAQIIRAARMKSSDTHITPRTLRSNDIPATLLNLALLNLSSGDIHLRMSSYVLLNELCSSFKYDLAVRVSNVSIGLMIPNNSVDFVVNLSRALAASIPNLSLEFLKEWTIGFATADTPQKIACLQYVAPWLANLDEFSRPAREDSQESIKQVKEIVRLFIALTIAERKNLYLVIQEHIWSVLTRSQGTLADIATSELIDAAVDSGIGSEKAECIGDMLVSGASTVIRGKVIARLRKTLAQTYLKPTPRISENASWPEICSLARISLALGFSPSSSLDTQIFLAEVFHVVTLLVGSGPVLMRQTVYGLVVNVIQSLAADGSRGDMDASTLQHLLQRAQQPEVLAAFGLMRSTGSIELSGLQIRDETEVESLQKVEEVTKLLGDVLTAGSVSVDCANAWRARWTGLVTATCFQHNPATQPQAFIVLGNLSSDEVDDDLVYQILVAMAATLSHFHESDAVLLISMIRCLTRIIPGLLPDSRYPASLFWLAVGILQLGHIPLFAPALELLTTALRAVSTSTSTAVLRGQELNGFITEARRAVIEQARKLDQATGLSFDTDMTFALVTIVYKGIRHPTTRKITIETLTELLELSTDLHNLNGVGAQLVAPGSVAYFVALLSTTSGSEEEAKKVFNAAGLGSDGNVMNLASASVFEILSIPDNSTALLFVSFVVALLNGSNASDNDRNILYKLLADASGEMPEVLAMTYDALIPRILATMATTSNLSILRSTTTILERALADPNYSLPNLTGLSVTDSSTSLAMHGKMYAPSISSNPSNGGQGAAREQVLEDLGMKGLGDLSFPPAQPDRLSTMAQWVASLIEGFTV
ncbi:hypothetical protein IAU60_006099 [Kwoniella sp. DSM 27419]